MNLSSTWKINEVVVSLDIIGDKLILLVKLDYNKLNNVHFLS